MFISSQFRRKLASAGLILLLCACTPALNWRDIRWQTADGSALKAILPCKADTATRKQQLGEFQVELSMMGCVANDATFTLSRISLADPLSAPKVLAAWQAASANNLQAKPADILTLTAIVSGASTWPPTVWQSVYSEVTHAHVLWFSKQSASGVILFQAAMYGKSLTKDSSGDAVNTFFESLQLQ